MLSSLCNDDDNDEMRTKFSKALISLNALNGSFQQFVLLALIGSGLTQCLQDLNHNDLDFWMKLRMGKSEPISLALIYYFT